MVATRRMPGWIDRREREPVRIAAVIVLRTGRSIPVTVVDMVPGGCRVEGEETLPIATTVRLELGSGIANAHVRWALNGAAG